VAAGASLVLHLGHPLGHRRCCQKHASVRPGQVPALSCLYHCSKLGGWLWNAANRLHPLPRPPPPLCRVPAAVWGLKLVVPQHDPAQLLVVLPCACGDCAIGRTWKGRCTGNMTRWPIMKSIARIVQYVPVHAKACSMAAAHLEGGLRLVTW
jgi:hypothetical protein